MSRLLREKCLKNLSVLKHSSEYRHFRLCDNRLSKFPRLTVHSPWDNKIHTDTLLWCSNDYLGMSVNDTVIANVIRNASQNGVGAGGTRNIGGSTVDVNILENDIARFHGKSGGALFSSGFNANVGTMTFLSTVLDKCVFFSDERNHASIIDGIRLSKCKKHVFKHNDIHHLKLLLEDSDSPHKVVVVESIYSMGGICDLVKVVELCKQYNCILVVDEIHAVTLYGHSGGGIVQMLGLEDEVDIITSGFGKGFGIIGGYAVASSSVTQCLRSLARSFIFTTALSSMMAEGIRTSITLVASEHGEKKRIKFHENVSFMKNELRGNGINFADSNSHIISIPMYSSTAAQRYSRELLKMGHYVQDINFPTVPRGQEILRVTVNCNHTFADIRNFVEAFRKVDVG